jgi:hypothetical protein
MFISAVKLNTPSPTKRKADVEWVKTPCPNLIRNKPSGDYSGRVRVNGKFIRRPLETHVLTVAEVRWIPLNSILRQLLETMRGEQAAEFKEKTVV